MELSEERIEIITMAGDLIRRDWSGFDYDGRDVKRWLETAIYGTQDEVTRMHKALKARLE